MDFMINYRILAYSIEHYEVLGYKRIEAPWAVSKAVSEITRPDGKQEYEIKHNDKVLVGSGEQSFLYLYLKNFLPKGKFQTVTPCFRDDMFDFTHTKYFMKNELINTETVTFDEMDLMVQNAWDFFKKYIPEKRMRKIPTQDGTDIMFGEYELGSYGIRRCEYLEWVFGTGVAEPRLSRMIKLL